MHPFDRVYIPDENEACQQYLAFATRSAQLQFDEPGPATIRRTGLKAYANEDELQTLVRTLTVVEAE